MGSLSLKDRDGADKTEAAADSEMATALVPKKGKGTYLFPEINLKRPP
jgi:hypothetical protein